MLIRNSFAFVTLFSKLVILLGKLLVIIGSIWVVFFIQESGLLFTPKEGYEGGKWFQIKSRDFNMQVGRTATNAVCTVHTRLPLDARDQHSWRVYLSWVTSDTEIFS